MKDPQLAGFQRTLDGEMKRLRSIGLGARKRQAEPIQVSEENALWEKGLLGCITPQVLVDTMVFLCGLYFALRSGQEHRSLTFDQIELFEPDDGPAYLVYTENVSKNNTGGLAQRKVQAKQVVHHSNTSNPERCFVQLFKIYHQHCPQVNKSSAFYLTPLKKPKGDIWYGTTPIGHNTLSKTVKRLCDAAGIGGFKTNHSLRVTSATRLFQSGVDEQLIMGRTGHRSIDGMRTYKRDSNEQKEDISHVLNSATNGGNILPQRQAKPPTKPRSHQFSHTICSKWTSDHQLDRMLLHYYKLHKVTPACIQTLFTMYIPHFIYTVHTF